MFETDGLTALIYGLFDAGVGVATGVVGFPVTDIISKLRPIWKPSVNEKVGFDIALGAAAIGTRSAFVSKHVGLNVASDSLITAATQGVGAGLIIIVGDDPGAHASQNEQDSRYYGKIAEVPVLEPYGVQNAYDSIVDGCTLSERLSVPVIVRITDRLLKLGGALERSTVEPVISARVLKDNWALTFLGKHQHSLQTRYPQLAQFAETTTLNEKSGAGAVGIISAGFASVLVDEATGEMDNVAHLKLSVTNPLGERHIAAFLEEHKNVVVVEEGAPIIEEAIRGKVKGKLSGHIPLTGTLTQQDIERALDFTEADYMATKLDAETLESRGHMTSVCQDCPFLPFYYALEQLGTIVAGDMGCVIKTANPPLKLIDVAYSLGSAIGVATGFENEGVAVLGDYAFLHGGVEALLSAILFKQSVKVFVLDNRVSAITGGQPTPEVADLVSVICRNYGILYKVIDAQSCSEVALQRLLRGVNDTTGTIVVVIKGTCAKYAGCRENNQV